MSTIIDPSAKMEPDAEEQVQLREKVAEDTRGILNYFWPFHPIQLALDLLWALGRLFRPLAPHLVPLAVFSATLPLILLLSIASGYLVWKSVAVSWETELFLQYGDGGTPFAEVVLANLGAQQPYDISLHLVVPANEANVALGNFMASLSLVTPTNTTIVDTRRPAIVLPPRALPWSYFYRPGTVNINLQMLSDFVVGTTRALARIELGRRDQWKTLGEGHGRELAVLSGTIRGIIKHHGFRGLIARFPLIFSIVAAGAFFFILFIGLVACLMPLVEWHFPSDEPRQLEPEEKPRRRRRSRRPERAEKEKDHPSSESRPKTPVRRGGGSGSRPRRASESHTDVKGEETDYQALTESLDVTSTAHGLTPQPMRRRVSRQPANDYFEQ
ncbi:hypothetical protein L227DRAFT_650115 [Lentinus tigrinus ALCF2SS1-6]|uniref:Adipose-regulatory protein n=1 Tax=Lentinus tigrinus ALCF2SS1-6 TaxID=1328759 RepID=A0A5C2SMX8_9APHY|nr:hypothetical protein L227DRAFT_650115 [Lentinus tigrinus ALCF2SS1-6]